MLKYNSLINSDKNNWHKITNSKLLIFIIFLVILIQIIFFILFFKIYNVLSNQLIDKRNITIIKNNENISNDLILENVNFTELINLKHTFQQKFFCENEILFNNTVLEDKIKVVTAKIDNFNFSMFVYKKNGYISNSISHKGFTEYQETKSILKALEYYSNKNHLTKNNIYVLDIGANIGWYTFLLGKKGYNILSFEPSKLNYYILLKSYCLNNDINVTIINKGLDIVEKNFMLYHPLDDTGNGVAFDGPDLLNFKSPLKEEVSITKLSHYIIFLKKNNLALIKLDIEGSEGNAIEGGLDLITNYHVPFVVMEWIPKYLKLKGTNPKSLLEIFKNNGYKFSITNFINNQYISIDKILKIRRSTIVIYIT